MWQELCSKLLFCYSETERRPTKGHWTKRSIGIMRMRIITIERTEANRQEKPTWWCRVSWRLFFPSSFYCCWLSVALPAADPAAIGPPSAGTSDPPRSRWSVDACSTVPRQLCSWNISTLRNFSEQFFFCFFLSSYSQKVLSRKLDPNYILSRIFEIP